MVIVNSLCFYGHGTFQQCVADAGPICDSPAERDLHACHGREVDGRHRWARLAENDLGVDGSPVDQ